jgi:hypothetical protein
MVPWFVRAGDTAPAGAGGTLVNAMLRPDQGPGHAD